MSPTPDDFVEYTPPIPQYRPDIGGREESHPVVPPPDGMSTTYANINYLRSILDALLATLRFAQAEFELVLNKFSLVITDTEVDRILRDANQIEWPSTLGAPKNYVTYKYYKILGIKSSKSAAYIRKRYEDAVRDVTGSNALDFMQLTDIIRDEALLVQDFIDSYIGNMDDSAEFRVAELFQDWAEQAILWTTRIQAMFEDPTNFVTPLPNEEIDSTTPEEARKAQALFKVKLNATNNEIAQFFEVFKKNYSDYADIFHQRFLGPALDFRLDVSRNVYPLTGQLGREMYTAAGALDTNFSSALTDQLRRNRIFVDRVTELMQMITMRDTYRGYIVQLSVAGQDIVAGDPGTTIDAQDSVEEFDAFAQILGTPTESPNTFVSPHNALDGRLDDDAHPQYLLQSGGPISGDVVPEMGVTIDGVDLDSHAHTGRDGSAQISGKDIKFGTLGAGVFNLTDIPPVPTNFRIISQNVRSVPGGSNIVDIVLAWEGSDDPTVKYEINLSAIG